MAYMSRNKEKGRCYTMIDFYLIAALFVVIVILLWFMYSAIDYKQDKIIQGIEDIKLEIEELKKEIKKEETNIYLEKWWEKK